MAPDDELTFLRWLEETDRPDGRLDVPLGDDGAVWRLDGDQRLVLAADALCEGSHFDSGTDPALVGRKALAVNLSDLAAMGARPICALATCALPRGFDLAQAQAMTDGMRRLGELFGCPIVGGDTVTHDGGVVLSVTAIGVPEPGGPITRCGAESGHHIAVTGALGGSRSGRHLTFLPRLSESRSLLELGPPSAMIDVSDGLLIDLHRIADSSGTGFRLDADRVPRHPDGGSPLDDGEDFELLFTAPPHVMESIQGAWDHPCGLTMIGEILEVDRILKIGGSEEPAPRKGFRHA